MRYTDLRETRDYSYEDEQNHEKLRSVVFERKPSTFADIRKTVDASFLPELEEFAIEDVLKKSFSKSGGEYFPLADFKTGISSDDFPAYFIVKHNGERYLVNSLGANTYIRSWAKIEGTVQENGMNMTPDDLADHIERVREHSEDDMILYHGSSEPIEAFENGLKVGRHNAVFLTDNPEMAIDYAMTDQERTGNENITLISVSTKDLDKDYLIGDIDHSMEDDWIESLNDCDQCMYQKDIPRSVLKIEKIGEEITE